MVYTVFDQDIFTQQEGLNSDSPVQDYYEIHKSLAGSQWTDDQFKHDTDAVVRDEALKFLREEKLGADAVFQWKRANEIISNPVFKTDSACSGKECDRFDIIQGGGGDCWFLSALDAISEKAILMRMVVPDDNVFDGSGIFHFRFWRYGNWIDIVVDDWLFCYVKPGGEIKLAFAQSRENELWIPLLEKAYAKLNGSYSDILGGFSLDALTDLTGGISKRSWTFQDQEPGNPKKFYKHFVNAYESGAIICLGIDAKQGQKNELVLPNGLVTCHEYAVTKMGTAPWEGKDVILIRIRNPYGDNEWNGDWSDEDEKWKSFDAEKVKSLGLDKSNGEFWMCYEDVIKNFVDIDVCYLGEPTACELAEDKDLATYWTPLPQFHNKWAEICAEEYEIARNPQYLLTLHAESTEKATVLYGITLKNIRLTGRDTMLACVKLHVFKINQPSERTLNDRVGDAELKDAEYFTPVETSESGEIRELTEELELDSGNYVLIPSYGTTEGYPGKYLLRVFVNGSANTFMKELK